MQTNAINPVDGVYPATPDYVHAMEITGAARLLFISGTMGLDRNGVAPAGIDEQLSLVWNNLRRILQEAAMTTDNIVRVTSYLRSASFAEANQAARIQALGSRRIPTTAIVVETLSPDWLVEVEVIAAG